MFCNRQKTVFKYNQRIGDRFWFVTQFSGAVKPDVIVENAIGLFGVGFFVRPGAVDIDFADAVNLEFFGYGRIALPI